VVLGGGGDLGDAHELGHDAVKIRATVGDGFRLVGGEVGGPQNLVQCFVLHLSLLLGQLRANSDRSGAKLFIQGIP